MHPWMLAHHHILQRGHVGKEPDVLKGSGDTKLRHRVRPEADWDGSRADGPPDAAGNRVIAGQRREIGAPELLHWIDPFALEFDGPAARFVEPGDEVEHGGLPGAVGADHGKD